MGGAETSKANQRAEEIAEAFAQLSLRLFNELYADNQSSNSKAIKKTIKTSYAVKLKSYPLPPDVFDSLLIFYEVTLKEKRQIVKELVDLVLYEKKLDKRELTFANVRSMYEQELLKRYPFLPTRVARGIIQDALETAKSFISKKLDEDDEENEKKRKYPIIKSVWIRYNDKQDWKLVEKDGKLVLKLKVFGRKWRGIELVPQPQYFRYKHLHLAGDLKIRPNKDGTADIIIIFKYEGVYEFEEENVIALDFNENNVTISIWLKGRPVVVFNFLTKARDIQVRYAKNIDNLKSINAKKKSKRLKRIIRKYFERMRNRVKDIMRKLGAVISSLAKKLKAVVVYGSGATGNAKRKMLRRQKSRKERRFLSLWNTKVLKEEIVQRGVWIEKVNEAHTSSYLFGTKLELSKSDKRAHVGGMGPVLRYKKVKGLKFYVERDANASLWIGVRYLKKVLGASPLSPSAGSGRNFDIDAISKIKLFVVPSSPIRNPALKSAKLIKSD